MMDTSPSPHSIDLLVRKASGEGQVKPVKHSRTVRWLRLVFPILALAMVVVVMTWKSDNAPLEPVARATISPQTVAQNELIKPTFQSEDSASRPYMITADKALQNASDMDAVVLEKPLASMTLQAGDALNITAAQGIFRQSQKTLKLDGGVSVQYKEAYRLNTSSMMIDMTAQTMTAPEAVKLSTGFARIESEGMTIDSAHKKVIFTGPTRLVFDKEAYKEQEQ